MINRLKHSINGVEFVPTNKDTFSLSANFPEDFGEWENSFTTENKVVLPNEAYIELIRHLNDVGVQQMPKYNISIDGQNNDFFVDLNQNVKVRGSLAEVAVKNYESKDNLKDSISTTTFEFLAQNGNITASDLVDIPYVVIPDDIGAKILGISTTIYTLTNEVIERVKKLAERVSDLIAGVIPSTGAGIVWPIGMVVRYGLLIASDIAILILLTIAIKNLIQQAFDLLQPPVRNFKAMTVDRLLTIALGHHNVQYSSSLKDDFKKLTVLTVPVDYQNKKFFQLLTNEDTRILNRGYPTASDTVSTCGALIDELCKIYNISPRIGNGILTLEPKQRENIVPSTTLDYNFSDQDKKEDEFELDMSKLWNTKILSYTNDSSDKMLFDNPKGLRVEYKTLPNNVQSDELTKIKGFVDIRINFALGTIKEETKLDLFLNDLAKASDNLLGTSFMAKMDARKGVLAISQEQFTVTKLLYQTGGKQKSDYLTNIGSNSIYINFHLVDNSKDNLYLYRSDVSVRMYNNQFQLILQNNFVYLETLQVEITSLDYVPESSSAKISYRVRKLEWSENMKSEKVYEE